MKVSVITVCLNAYNTLHRCLDSVKNQNYQEIEQIIVDGRSTDGTQKIIESYKKNINKIIIEKDKGIYDAMNKGLRNATGEIVCFLNSDDFYSSKNIISYVVQKFKEENIDVFAGDVAFFKKNNESKIIRKFSSSVFAPEKMKYGLMPAHPALFLRRELVNKIGFFKENYKIAGDFEFMLRIFKNINIKYLYQPKIIVHMQIGGISTRGIKSYLLSNKEILRACKENNVKTNFLNIFLRYFYKIKELIVKQ